MKRIETYKAGLPVPLAPVIVPLAEANVSDGDGAIDRGLPVR